MTTTQQRRLHSALDWLFVGVMAVGFVRDDWWLTGFGFACLMISIGAFLLLWYRELPPGRP